MRRAAFPPRPAPPRIRGRARARRRPRRATARRRAPLANRFAAPTQAIESAIAISTGARGRCTSPAAPRPSVKECASVKAVTIFATDARAPRHDHESEQEQDVVESRQDVLDPVEEEREPGASAWKGGCAPRPRGAIGRGSRARIRRRSRRCRAGCARTPGAPGRARGRARSRSESSRIGFTRLRGEPHPEAARAPRLSAGRRSTPSTSREAGRTVHGRWIDRAASAPTSAACARRTSGESDPPFGTPKSR